MVNLTHAGFRSRKGRRSRKRLVQQRRRRAGRWRADSRARRRRSRERPAASNTSGCAGNDTATPGCPAGLSAAVNTSARSNPSVTVPDERGRTRLRRRLWRPSGVVYAVSADGMFRTLGLVSGKDVRRPAPFVPAGARFSDLIAVNDRVYAATSNGCGGAADGIWSIDISSDTKPVVSWKTNGGSPIGSVAFATNGTAIVAIGPGTVTAGGYANAIVALDPKTLALMDWFRRPVWSSRRRPWCFRSLVRISPPSRPRMDAFCCSTPPHSAARITTRRSLRRRHLPAAPRRSRRSHRPCGRSAPRCSRRRDDACCFGVGDSRCRTLAERRTWRRGAPA